MNWKLKEFERSSYKILEVVDESGEVIKTFVADELTYSEKKKKAQLMAAAPELLENAKEIVMEIGSFGFASGQTLMNLENAIRKAKGDGR